MSQNYNWSLQLDWLNILKILGLVQIEQISESKKSKALKRIDKVYGSELLYTLKPDELDQIVANELRVLMKKELNEISRQNEKIERVLQNKMLVPKKGGAIEDIMKFLSRRLNKDDEDDDFDADDEDEPDEDKSGIYI